MESVTKPELHTTMALNGIKQYSHFMVDIRSLLLHSESLSLTLGEILEALNVTEKDDRDLFLIRNVLQDLRAYKEIGLLVADDMLPSVGIHYTPSVSGHCGIPTILRDLKIFCADKLVQSKLSI